MTRRDFRLLAATVKEMRLTNLARISVAEDLADALEKAYPNFNREVFLEACGVL